MTWTNVDYNHGHFFDGTFLTVPENGLYCFHVTSRQESSTRGYIQLYINGNRHIFARRAESNGNFGFVSIDTTLELAKNDKVDVRFHGRLECTSDKEATYFEGRLVARLNE